MGCLLVEEMTNCSAIRLDRRIVYVTEGKLIIQAQKELNHVLAKRITNLENRLEKKQRGDNAL